MKIIDAFGKQCPLPLVMAKKELDAGCAELGVQVDNETAVKNLSRLGEKQGIGVSVDEIEGGWLVSFVAGERSVAVELTAPSDAPASAHGACGPAGCGYAVFIKSDSIGTSEGELGGNLMKMALYTLSEAGDPPASLLFMNEGVKLIVEGQDQNIESVRKLMEQGTEVLVCGTCLDFYGLKEKLAVGEVSNMYDILGRMREAAKVIEL